MGIKGIEHGTVFDCAPDLLGIGRFLVTTTFSFSYFFLGGLRCWNFSTGGKATEWLGRSTGSELFRKSRGRPTVGSVLLLYRKVLAWAPKVKAAAFFFDFSNQKQLFIPPKSVKSRKKSAFWLIYCLI